MAMQITLSRSPQLSIFVAVVDKLLICGHNCHPNITHRPSRPLRSSSTMILHEVGDGLLIHEHGYREQVGVSQITGKVKI